VTTPTSPPPFTPARFALLLALGLLASSGAFWLSMQRHLPRDASYGTQALPGLAGRLTEVDRVRLIAADRTTVTLTRRDGHFVVEERAGFAADPTRVHALLAALADLKIAERHPVARSQWAARGPEPGTRIDLSGRLPARSLVVGAPVGPENVWLRVGEDDEVLEAGPALSVDAHPGYWLRKRLIDIAPDDVVRIEYGPPASALVIERGERGAPFARRGPAAPATTQASLAQLQPTLLRALDVQDVRAARGSPAMLRTVVETYAGLHVECHGYAEGSQRWLRLTVRHVPAAGAGAQDSERAREVAERLAAASAGFDLQIAPARFAELFINLAAAPELRP